MVLVYFLPFLVFLFPSPTQGSTPTQANSTFCYERSECGPTSDEWPGICQTGKHQSPINLPHNLDTIARARTIGKPLTFNGYRGSNFLIKNNGHSIQVSFTPDLTSSSIMDGYGLEDKYVFAQAHFHWGKNIMFGGSEHTVNGIHYPMEIHLVHYDSKYGSYANATTASNDPKALSVLAIFLDPVPQFLGMPRVSSAFNLIANNLPAKYQTTAGNEINKTLDLTQFLPRTGDTIYRYSGSLTTPGCAEIVEWTVIPEPIVVSRDDYWKFHTVLDEDDEALSENFRPVQQLHERKIELFHRSVE